MDEITNLVTNLGANAGAVALVWWLITRRLPADDERNRAERAELSAGFIQAIKEQSADHKLDRAAWADRQLATHRECEAKMQEIQERTLERMDALASQLSQVVGRIEQSLKRD